MTWATKLFRFECLHRLSPCSGCFSPVVCGRPRPHHKAHDSIEHHDFRPSLKSCAHYIIAGLKYVRTSGVNQVHRVHGFISSYQRHFWPSRYTDPPGRPNTRSEAARLRMRTKPMNCEPLTLELRCPNMFDTPYNTAPMSFPTPPARYRCIGTVIRQHMGQ